MNRSFRYIFIGLGLLLAGLLPLQCLNAQVHLARLKVKGHYFCTASGAPFFYLGDTGWLLFKKLNREETLKYLDNRQRKGFNVIQVMLIHDLKSATDAYGDSAFHNRQVANPRITAGSRFGVGSEYDYWDHVDWVIKQAAKRGLYMAMVPIWGTNVKKGMVSRAEACAFAKFLALRYRKFANIIWLDGGDIQGSDSIAQWKIIGETLKKMDPHHLLTFHPRGRCSSSQWFHNEKWLDFNMCQSGHKDYSQDTVLPVLGEDNWKLIDHDYALDPVKPVLDGEPSYENIPHGLHDTLAPRWKDSDVRRYAYWNLLSGGAGFTYGHVSLMEMYKTGEPDDYGVREPWQQAMDDPGAFQMAYLKKLVFSHPYFERVPDQKLIVDSSQGIRYNYLLSARGRHYAYVYTYNGRPFSVRMGIIGGTLVKASWFNPRNGQYTPIGNFQNKGMREFKAPGSIEPGHDWVLILESR